MSSILGRAPFAYVVKDTEHLASDVTFQATDDFRFGLTLFYTPLQVYPGSIVVTEPDDHYSIEGGVRLAVAATVEAVAGGAGFARSEKNRDENRLMAIELWKTAKEKVTSGNYNMVILDELSYPLRYGWLPVEEVLEVFRNRPPAVHIVITGRDMPGELIEMADMVTEMKKVKHHLSKGVKAQPRIEF